jgi:hypothetical protein
LEDERVSSAWAWASALANLLDDAMGLGDIWIARADHIAQWWRDQHGE